MRHRRVFTILNKDLTDAFRDGRVYVALLLPIAMAVGYNLAAPERNERPSSNIVIVDQGGAGLRKAIGRATERSVELKTRVVRNADEARRLVRAGDEEMAVVAGPEDSSRATVLLPEDASPEAQTVARIVPDAVAALAKRPPASQVRVEQVPVDQAQQTPAEIVEPSVLIIAASIVTLAGFVAC